MGHHLTLETAADRRAAAHGGAMALSGAVDEIDRAFRLAYFIRPDRTLAMRVTIKALSYLDDVIREQGRRRYSQPKAYRTKASRSRSQLLQHLVCCLTDSLETRWPQGKATAARIAEDDLLVRFVVDLVSIAVRRSSFYVNLSISRILHDYSTADAMAIHDLLAQNPERMRNDSYFRYGKGLLQKEMRQRFGFEIETAREARGELRLCPNRPGSYQAALVGECLLHLTPWETRCPLPDSFDPLQETLPDLCFTEDCPDAEHPVELRRMHAVLHPHCYLRATRALGLDTPAQRLRIPRFIRSDNRGDRDAHQASTTRRPQALSVEERAAITAELRVVVARRRRWSIRQLTS